MTSEALSGTPDKKAVVMVLLSDSRIQGRYHQVGLRLIFKIDERYNPHRLFVTNLYELNSIASN